ncbi:MAG TPA: aspartyl protease [Cyanobacteria bacterium UBA11691]|nr:aspartyl protease [Cyanobacteria bacterium UBA11691]
MQGSLGENNELLFEIRLVTTDGIDFTIDAMLDTGFSGWLTLDIQDLDGLDVQYIGTQNMQLATGEEVEFNLYTGSIYFDRQEVNIIIHAALGIPQVLLGRQLLINRRLVVDISSSILTLGETTES